MCDPIPRDRSKRECEDRPPALLTHPRHLHREPLAGWGWALQGTPKSLNGWAPNLLGNVPVGLLCAVPVGDGRTRKGSRSWGVGGGEQRKGEAGVGGTHWGAKGLPQRHVLSLVLNRFPFPKPNKEEFILSSRQCFAQGMPPLRAPVCTRRQLPCVAS